MKILATTMLLLLFAATASAATTVQVHGSGDHVLNSCTPGPTYVQDGLTILHCGPPITGYAASPNGAVHLLAAPSPSVPVSPNWQTTRASDYGIPATATYALVQAYAGCHGSYDNILAATAPNPTAAQQILVAGYGAGGRQGVGGYGGAQAFVPILSGFVWMRISAPCEGANYQYVGYE